jgi:hypothetical protein
MDKYDVDLAIRLKISEVLGDLMGELGRQNRLPDGNDQGPLIAALAITLAKLEGKNG